MISEAASQRLIEPLAWKLSGKAMLEVCLERDGGLQRANLLVFAHSADTQDSYSSYHFDSQNPQTLPTDTK